ncbi:hypothetical protein RB623_09485 [Mesorhizobium sp. LHD-90]|uniref:hypothetical protein n=1 Tax=Mesorhizobium sp. LHD-90 TaxID=3071414 RepID=UPI0027E01357|nr:hypothetical protein [Mesorhizobium sp. LHD-90]MDQ6434280.1 hypothetical protein [Mesorhizobium sp. LHD-90]
MDEFRMMATVLSMILGLGVTRLLLGLVTVFRIRRTAPVDWMPLAWAGIVFVVQLQFWWGVNQLPAIRPAFAFGDFVFLVALTLMLFLSAALLLPSRAEDESEGLRTYFERDGRYGLLAFASFLVLGFVVNLWFFREALLGLWSVLDIPMIVLPVAAFLSKSRRAQTWITVLYVPLMLVDVWVSL